MSDRRVLDNWKEIAAYLGRTGKTCRNWEKEYGLPVHRLDGSPRAHVFAYADELERWKEEMLREEKRHKGTARGLEWDKELLGQNKVGGLILRLLPRLFRRPLVAIPGVIILVGAIAAAVWYFGRQAKIRWATNEILPRIDQLVEEEEYFGAFKLAQQAQKYIAKNPSLQKEWPKFSASVSVVSTPPGASVYIRDYKSSGSDWESLGRTPLENITIPFGLLRWKIEKQEFTTQEYALDTKFDVLHPYEPFSPELREITAVPEGMVWVRGGTLTPPYSPIYVGRPEPIKLNGFWLDKYEVTNRKFKEFIDRGGYTKPEYWRQPFLKDGKPLAWEEAMKEFRDKTGSPGPAQWELGTYQKGQDDYPVSGVSWYEAAAYAEFAGKSLPTIYHWLRAATFTDKLQYFIPGSNISGQGPARVGSFQGMSFYGVYDMVGNVKEWCWNEIKDMRYIMGGAWDDEAYMASMPFSKSPFNRDLGNGFRCAQDASPGETPSELREPIVLAERDYSREKPVTDQVFEVYKGLYAYDKTDLNPKIELRDESEENWIKEKISFDVAYDNLRMTGYLFLPKKGAPPFATVIYYPSGTAFFSSSSENIGPEMLDFLLVRGRAVFYPVFLSTYERRDGYAMFSKNRNPWRDHCFKWSQDLGRSIDYLETRAELNKDKFAFYGVSLGGIVGPVLLAVEPRIEVGILEAGGFVPGSMSSMLAPEDDPFNFAPRVKIPVLMLNGRYDILRRMEEGQAQLFKCLGTPPENKARKIYDTDHHAPRLERIKEVTAFLDKYLK
jgi:formylglycine-generating enzyme required for sulfatase activity